MHNASPDQMFKGVGFKIDNHVATNNPIVHPHQRDSKAEGAVIYSRCALPTRT